MTRRLLLPSVCFVFSSLVGLPSAQADYLNIAFQGTVTHSADDLGNLFDAGVGGGTVVGEAVTGSFLIDLAMSQNRGTDYEVGGSVFYAADENIGPERYITSQVNIGGRNFILGPSTTYTSDEEFVWMFQDNFQEYEDERDYLEIEDEYYYENENGLSSFRLEIAINDIINTFLDPALNLDQEFLWVDSQVPTYGAGGRFLAEAEEGIGIAGFSLNTVKASLVPTEVPEPSSIGILLTALLVGMGLRQRPLHR